MDVEHEVFRALADEDRRYVDHWTAESGVWRQAGMYKKVASLVDLKPEHWHADFCAGYGFPLFSLYGRAPKDSTVQLIAVERIQAMLDETVQLARDYGIPTSAHILSEQHLTQDLVASRTYTPRMECEELFGKKSAITLIQDDVRSANVFRHVMKGRALDSASMLFPGSSGRSAFEAPYPFLSSKDPNDYRRRLSEQVREARKGAVALATEFIRPGGTYIIAERIMRMTDVTREEIAHEAVRSLQEFAGPLIHGWDRAEFFLPDADISEAHGPMDWIDFNGETPRIYSNLKASSDWSNASVYVLKATRNAVPFGDLEGH